MGIDIEEQLLAREFVFSNTSCIVMKYSVVIPMTMLHTIERTFPENVYRNLYKILDKKYFIVYDITKNEDILQRCCTYIIYKNGKPIYFESYEDMFKHEISKFYYPKYWSFRAKLNRFMCVNYESMTKPFLFDLKNFMWRLNLKKAKILINDKVY